MIEALRFPRLSGLGEARVALWNAIWIGVVTAVVGALLGAVGAAMPISTKESGPDARLGAAYAKVFLPMAGAMIGALVGLIAGVVGSQVLPVPAYFKLLGIIVAGVFSLDAVAAFAACRNAEREPKIHGRLVDFEYEVRMPVGRDWPPPPRTAGAPQIVLAREGKALFDYPLDLAGARQENRRWLLAGRVPLKTDRGVTGVSFHVSDRETWSSYFFIEDKLSAARLEWSEWLDAGWTPGQPKPKPEANFNLRYRLRYREAKVAMEEPDPRVAAAQDEDRKFAALTPEAPLADWLEFLKYDTKPERVEAIMAVAAKRQGELAGLIRSGNETLREQALDAVARLAGASPELSEAVLREGRDIAREMAKFNELNSDAPGFHSIGLELSSRFESWRPAWWRLRKTGALRGDETLSEIHRLTKVHRMESGAMHDIEINARATLEAR